MDPVATCPSRQDLERLMQGQLPLAEVEQYARHLEGCDSCAQTIAASPVDDTLVEVLRKQAAAQSGPLDPALAGLTRRLRELRNMAGSTGETIAPETNIVNKASQPTVQKAAEPAEQFDFLAPPEQPDEIGRLGPYRVLKVLGKGGMGMVFKAEDPHLGRMCALKTMLPAMASRPEMKKRFLLEARAAAQLEHDNIIPIYQVAEDRGVPYIAMPFLKGASLEDFLKQKNKGGKGTPLSPPQILKLGREMARGLAAAHEKGMIHRDIKPANIWLDGAAGGRVKILDFGLARLAQTAGEQNLTQSGAIMGTPSYMAPEQARAEKIDGRADLFSLGVILYRLCTGELPFKGSDPISTLMALATHDPAPPAAINAAIPAALSDLVMRLLAKDSGQRTASANQVLKDLQAVAAALPSAAEPPASAVSSASLTASPSTPASVAPSIMTDQQANSRAATAAALPVVPRGTKKAAKTHASVRPPFYRRPAGLAAMAGGVFAIIVAAVFYIETSKGTIRVEITDPDIEVTIKGTEFKFTGADKEPITVKPGEGEKVFEVTRGPDFKFETDKLILKKGDRVVVKVELSDGVVRVSHAGKPLGSERWPSVDAAQIAGSGNAPPPAVAPFDAAQAKAHQEAWARHLGVPVEYTNSIGMMFRLIPPGEFIMGSTPEDIFEALQDVGEDKQWQDAIKSEFPRHQVILTRPMFLSVYELTQGQYQKVMGTNPSVFAVTGSVKEWSDNVAGMETSNHPVESISWNDAIEFCAKMSSLEKLKPAYIRAGATVTQTDGTGYRLPTEAEWEHACRAGTTTKYCLGDRREDLLRAGWFGANANDRTHVVGELTANSFGLHDLHGNVWEWVQDEWNASYYAQFRENAAVDPTGAASGGPLRVVRGGYRRDSASVIRTSSRYAQDSGYRENGGIGVRLVLSVDAVKGAMSHPTPDAHSPQASAASAEVASKTAPWINLLQTDELKKAAEMGRGLNLHDGVLKIRTDATDESTQFWLSSQQHKNARMRIKLLNNDRQEGFGVSMGWDFGGGEPRRLDAFIGHFDQGKPCVDLWKYDANFNPTGVGAKRFDPDFSQPLVVDLEIRNGEAAVQVADVVIRAPQAVAADRAAFPFLSVSKSSWTVLEWQVQSLEDAPPSPATAPFNASQAKAHQEAWAKYLGVPVEYTNSIGMKFRLIPPGVFKMGSDLPGRGPRHTVELTRPFFIGVHEVSQDQYETVVGRNPSWFSASGAGKEIVAGMETASFPVESVCWNDAAIFAVQLSKLEKLQQFYSENGERLRTPNENGYRLPTEAEWEFACRAGTTTHYWTGNNFDDVLTAGWTSENASERTHPVGGKKANPLGLFDTHGNVWEWCEDIFDEHAYERRQGTTRDPIVLFTSGPERHVMKGGPWLNDVVYAQSANRIGLAPDDRNSFIGFRLALTVETVLEALRIQTSGRGVGVNNLHSRPAADPLPAIAPFDTAQAKAHQEAWANHLGVPVEYTNSIGMKFRLIPPGEFLMGSSEEEVAAILKETAEPPDWLKKHLATEVPARRVTLTRPFYCGVHEVTIDQFREFVKSGYEPESIRDGLGGNVNGGQPLGTKEQTWEHPHTWEVNGEFPVTQVTWNDATAFADWLAKSQQRPGSYGLPTEAQWEYACRAGTTTRYSTGESLPPKHQAWGRPFAVGRGIVNAYGLCDMHGNVAEWCLDADIVDAYRKLPSADPVGMTDNAPKHMVRGGGNSGLTPMKRSSHRVANMTSDRLAETGFRLTMSVDAVRETQPRGASLDPAGAEQGLSFASGGHVDLPSLPPLSQPRFCIEAFVTPLDFAPPGEFGPVLHAPGQTMLRVTGPDSWEFVLLMPAATATPGGVKVEKNRRVHLAATRDGNTLALYRDGQRVGIYTHPGEELKVTEATSKPRLGESFPGVIHQVRVSKTPRYEGDFQPAAKLEADADTEALYRFDEGQGDVLKDSSGNNHHGKIVVAKWVRGESAAEPPTVVKGEWRNLLGNMVLPRDAVRGNWKFDGAKLVSPKQGEPGNGNDLVKVPTVPALPAAYDLRLTVERLDDAGQGFNLVLPTVAGQTMVVMDGFKSIGSGWAVELVEGKIGKDNESLSKGMAFTVGKQVDVLVEVRPDRVSASGGGQRTEWEGSVDRLSLHPMWETKTPGLLLGSQGNFVVHRLEWRPMTDEQAAQPRPIAPAVAWTESGLQFTEEKGRVNLPNKMAANAAYTVEVDLTPAAVHPVPELYSIWVLSSYGNVVQQGDRFVATAGKWPNPRGQIQVDRMVRPGQRTQVAMTLNNLSLKLFVDGRLVKSQEITKGEPAMEQRPVFLGRSEGSGGHRAFDGLIHRFRLSDDVRYKDTYKLEDEWTADESTLVLYDFRADPGSEVQDRSGRNHHGKIVQGKWIKAAPASAKKSDE